MNTKEEFIRIDLSKNDMDASGWGRFIKDITHFMEKEGITEEPRMPYVDEDKTGGIISIRFAKKDIPKIRNFLIIKGIHLKEVD